MFGITHFEFFVAAVFLLNVTPGPGAGGRLSSRDAKLRQQPLRQNEVSDHEQCDGQELSHDGFRLSGHESARDLR